MVSIRIFKSYYTKFLLLRGAPQKAITCGGKRMLREKSPDTITLLSLRQHGGYSLMLGRIRTIENKKILKPRG